MTVVRSNTESCSLSPASISSLSARVGGCAVVSQPPLSFISACTRVLSSLVVRRISRVVVRHPLLPPPLPSPLYFLSPSLHMNTEQARVDEGTRENRGHARSNWIGSRGYSVVSKFPGTRTRPGTGDTRSIREVGGLLQRHDHPGPLLQAGDSPSRTCARIITYTCAHLSPPCARVPRDARGFIAFSGAATGETT